MLIQAALAISSINAPASTSADLALANGWLALLDAKGWVASWNDTGRLFQSNLTQEQWIKTVQTVREPLGSFVSRANIGSQKAKSLPGVPDGEYSILRYQTVFSNKASSIETVVLALENGQWRIVGYFIR
jgi:hypothetical protein